MWWWDRLIEDRIQAGIEKGLFDNLRGQGKRLPLDDDLGQEWLANHLLREAGVLPEWLELRRQVYAERPSVLAALWEYREAERQMDVDLPGQRAILQRLEERYIELAREINRKIDLHNLRCPSIHHELARFQEDALARERRFARGY